MSADRISRPNSTLTTDRGKLEAFQRRGRESSARSLREGRKGERRRPRAISPASPVQRAKVAGCEFCAICGEPRSDWRVLTPMHLADRSKGGCDSADCVIAGCCTPELDGCHDLYDVGLLDILRVLSDPDKHRAYLRELQHMLEHVGPVQLVEQLANDRVVWASAVKASRGGEAA